MAEHVETFCALVIFQLTLATFADDPWSLGVQERLAPLQSRLVAVMLQVRESYHMKASTVATKEFDDILIGYFNDDIGV